jgi:hypothetical protein
VIGSARRAGVSVVVTLAGGYAENIGDIADIHAATIETLLDASLQKA